MTGPPGYGFFSLLTDLEASVLRDLTAGAAEFIELLGNESLGDNDLAKLVLQIHQPHELLQDRTIRRRLLEALPKAKKDELAHRLSGPITPEDIPRLEIDRESSHEATLYSFLGIADSTMRVRDAGPQSDRIVSPDYGLFSYQRRAVDKVWAVLEQFPRRAVLHLPTGAGKTRCAMHLICRQLLLHSPTVVVWLAYNQELLEQAASEFERAWTALGDRDVKVIRFWGSTNVDPTELKDGLVVGGLGKLYSRYSSEPDIVLSLADRVTFTVFDEAHQAIASTFGELAELFSEKRPGSRLLGLTATPGRTWADITEDERLADFFGRRKVILEVEGYENPVRYLIDEGYLADPTFRTLNVDAGVELSEADRSQILDSLDISEDILDRMGKSKEYTIKVIQEIINLTEAHRRILVFASSVQQANTIAAVLLGLGVSAASITANTAEGERLRGIKTFRSNLLRPMVLVNYGVLTAGFDAPGTSCVVIARPTKSLVLFSQMVGRGIRGVRAGGQRKAEIVTVVDPKLPGFGDIAEAFINWEDVWA